MSDYRRKQGKLKYYGTFMSKNQIYDYLIDGYTKDNEFIEYQERDPYCTITDYLFNRYDLEFIITKDLKLFQIIEINDIYVSDSWCSIKKEDELIYSFNTQYYDGGTCYQEMLEDKLNELEL